MQRITTATKAVDLFTAGKHGFKDGNLALGVSPTDLNAAWFNHVQEELLSVIEGAGLVADGAVLSQVRQAIKRIVGGNVTSVNFAVSPFVLAADHAGVVSVDATAGNVVITLPAANVLAGLPYEFRRVDATANTVTVNRAGADTIDEGGTSFALASKVAQAIRSNGVTSWSTVSQTTQYASDTEAQALSLPTKSISPGTLKKAFQGSNQSLAGDGYQKIPGGLILQFGSGASSASAAVTITFPVAYTATPRVFLVPIYGSAVLLSAMLEAIPSTANFLAGQFTSANARSAQSFLWFSIGY